MAVKSSWSPGDVLAAADLTDTFGAKATYAYGTAAPTSPTTGQLWMDISAGTAVPLAKVYTGSGWSTFSNGAAVVASTTGSPATGTVVDSGVTYTYYHWTADGSIVLSGGGLVQAFLISGGGQGNGTNFWGGAGAILWGTFTLAAGTHAVTIGLGGGQSGNAERYGKQSLVGSTLYTGRSSYTDNGSLSGLVGAGATNADRSAAFSTSITGTPLTFGLAGQASPRANCGDGAQNGLGSNGAVILRVRS